MNRVAAAVAFGLVGGALALASPAEAHHAAPLLLDPEFGDCGQVTLTATLPDEPHGSYAGAALVVQVGDEQHVKPLGEPLTVGSFEQERVAISWRIWGGGERGYDVPPLLDLDALLDFMEGLDRKAGTDDDRSPLDPLAWGTDWKTFGVEGCIPPVYPCPTCPEPSPSVSPEPSPSPSPTVEPTPSAGPSAGPSGEPSVSPGSPVAVEGELPETGNVAVGVIAAVGVGLLAAGAWLVLAARRRKPATATE